MFVTSPRRKLPTFLSKTVFAITSVVWSACWCVSAEEAESPAEDAVQSIVIQDVSEELKRGDGFYQEGDYGSAVASYGIARDKLVKDPAQVEMKIAATERLAQASVEYAKHLSRQGRREEAAALLDTILAKDVFPGYAPALQMREMLDDPLRSNPALDPQHVENVDKVRRLLYEAEGFEGLGRFDDAYLIFEEVLKVDPYNKAARRGMERANRARGEYGKVAYDARRSRMLAEVDANWEGRVNQEIETGLLEVSRGSSGNFGATAREKLTTIMVPAVDLEGVDIYEAVDFLRQQARTLDIGTLNEAERGVGIVIDLGVSQSETAQKIAEKRFDLTLSNVPLGKVLDYINAATSTRSRIDEYAVVIRPLGATGEELLRRTYQVPPNFLSRESINQQGGDDPFEAEDSSGGGLLAKRMTAREFLEAQGVNFPEGTSAIFQRGTGSLVVRNTSTNLDFIDQIISSINEQEPVAVIVEVTFVKVQESILEELGFDWMLTPADLGGGGILGGGSIGSGTEITDFGTAAQNPLTAGNRSGAAARLNDSIDAVINGDRVQSSPRAPGILSVTGKFSNDGELSVLMRGLRNHGADDQVIKKSVVTRSGQVAKVEVTRRFPYPTEYEPPELPNSVGSGGGDDEEDGGPGNPIPSAANSIFPVTPATPTAFDNRDVGCILEVEPLVGAQRHYIEMSLAPALVEFDGFVDYGSPITAGGDNVITPNNIFMPIFSKTGINTSVTIVDGETVIIGGLLKSSTLQIEDSVPILGDLPLVGRLFQSESESTIREALMIFVNARLVDPSGQSFRDR